ncbi:MAG: hypothetical protein R6W31_00465 [Bacteroidales bacterium]
MRTTRTIGIILALVIFSLTGQRVQAQNHKDNQAEEKAMQEAELKAKKEMLEKQHMEFMEQEMILKEMEGIPQISERNVTRITSRPSMVFSSGDAPAPYFQPFGDQGNQSQITLRNTFKGGSDHASGAFEVDETTQNFRCMIRGKVSSGEIRIKLIYPDGKIFKEQNINPSAEVTFTQSVIIQDSSSKKYFGSWTYEIKADEAQGDYMLQISTN